MKKRKRKRKKSPNTHQLFNSENTSWPMPMENSQVTQNLSLVKTYYAAKPSCRYFNSQLKHRTVECSTMFQAILKTSMT